MNLQDTIAKVRQNLWPLLAVVAIFATAPLVYFQLPNYLPSHIAQGAAIVIGVSYFSFFCLWEKYPDWVQRTLLVVAFASPLDNLLAMKIIRKAALDGYVGLELFRPVILLLLAATLGTIIKGRIPEWPPLLKVSALLATAAWFISSVSSADPAHAFAVGFFELLIPFVAIYAYSATTPDRNYTVHCLTLFVLGFTVVAASQSAAILSHGCCALTAQDFLADKMDLAIMKQAGDNGYGNPTNFIALWVAMGTLVAGSLLISNGFRKTRISLLFFLLYAGLLVYSRSGLIIEILGLLSILAYVLFSRRRLNLAIAVAIAFLIAIHVPSGGTAYFRAGIMSFLRSNFQADTVAKSNASRELQYSAEDVMSDAKKIDNSGVDRAQAIAAGLSIAQKHWITGIGSGHYVRIDKRYTAPHSMLVLHFAETGILGLASLLFLFAVPPVELARRNRQLTPFAVVAGISASCFSIYGMVFGGSMADRGNVAWGLAMALMIASLVTDRSRNPVLSFEKQ